MSDRETADDIEEAAARWVLVLDRTGRSPETARALDSWLAGDPRRAGAFLQAEAAWARLDRGRGFDHATPVTPEPRFDHATPVTPEPRFDRRRLIAGGAAALAASVAGGILLLPEAERFETRTGEIRRVPLSDGSTVAINTASDIAVRMTERGRDVVLDRGEAWFQVAKDKQRPFVVEAGAIRVQAVGTAFAVRRRRNGADILVSEGVVETWTTGAKGASIRLTAGQGAFLAADARVDPLRVTPPDIDRRLAWRAGKIDLAGETLATAAAEFNRYNRRRIEVAPPVVDRQFYGVFRTDDPEGFARAVAISADVRVELADPGVIRIGA